MIKITFKDGSVKEFESGLSVLDIAAKISEGLARNALGALVNGELSDLRKKLTSDCKLIILTFDDEEGKKVFRHTSSHILAQAIKKLYPDAKLAIGPAIDNGFYYDFDFTSPFSESDIPKVEAEMKSIVKENLTLEYFELPRTEAIKLMEERKEPYKVELINDLPVDSVLSFYKQGDFVDLCAGPHLTSTGAVKAIKIQSVAGAYWRGSEKNKMLTRIYATSFPKASLLDEYLLILEEAKKRDHKKLGRELELFMMADEGPGFPFLLPKGMILRNQLEAFWRDEHQKAGYQEVKTPMILNRKLWETSGHWFHYKENMYTTQIDEEDYAIKPMNCPGGMMIYNSKLRSYKDLPLRMGELGLVHRHEVSGALNGLFRVRCFTQDDAHIFMTNDQIRDEIIGVVNLIDKFYSLFGFEYHIELSTKPEKAMGSDEVWEIATDSLKEALETMGIAYKINEGDGAFYGPKLDFKLRDSIGRTWQCGTIQLDFQLAERFDLTYIGADGEKHRPVMLHRVIFGSIERFMGILIEHFAGAFPTWLSPVQVKVLPISDKYNDYAKSVVKKLQDSDVRVELDDRAEKIGFKIREAQLDKAPYMLIVGEEEQTAATVSVRKRGEGDIGSVKIDEFVDGIVKEIKDKK